MGFPLELLFLSPAPVYLAYRASVYHVQKTVREVAIPASTLLSNYCDFLKNNQSEMIHYNVAYEAAIQKGSKFGVGGKVRQSLRKSHLKADNLSVDNIVYEFLNMPLLWPEKTILTKLLLFNAAMPTLAQLKQGRHIIKWTIHERTNREILLTWGIANVHGSNWFFLPEKENVILFGSTLHFSHIPQGPASGRPTSLIGSSLWLILVGFHKFYSMLLLHSVKNRIKKHTS